MDNMTEMLTFLGVSLLLAPIAIYFIVNALTYVFFGRIS